MSKDVGLDETAVSDATVASGAAPVGGKPTRELPKLAADRYVIAGEVGRGGLGRVLRARDEVLDRPVALKELFATDDASRRRFIREVLITARLQHPSIVPVYDAGRREDASPVYAMKLVAGRPLDRAIAGAETFEQRLALLPTVLAVADAIAYAHSQRIIHRDLKPGNVLVGEFGETIVIDWGLAKDLSIDDHEALEAGPYRGGEHTVAGAVMGTPGYMAPEQAAGEDVDERADVYALGAILYHVVSGTLPHRGTTFEEVITRVINGDVRPLTEIEPQTPRDLATIIGKAMAREPAQRYRNARDLADDLRRFQTGQLVGAHHYTATQRFVRWIRRHRAIAAVSTIALVVLVVFGTWSIRRILDETTRAEQRAREATASANNAIVSQARAMHERDPALALAWLAKMDASGPGWDAARVIAADALAHPRLVRLVRGPNPMHSAQFAFRAAALKFDRIHITLDGQRAVGVDPHGVWIANLATGDVKLVPEKLSSQESHAIELCDDSRRALMKSGGFGSDQVLDIDLVAGKVAANSHMRAREWTSAVESCNAERALKATDQGLAFRGAVLTTVPIEKAWIAPDREHVVALERAGGVRRFTLGGKELGWVPGPAPLAIRRLDMGTGWPSPSTTAVMSRDGSVAITEFGETWTYWNFTTGRHLVLQTGLISAAITPDGALAFTSTREEAWAIEDPAAPREAKDSEVPHGELAMSPDGKWLVASINRAISIKDLTSGAVRRLTGHANVDGVAWLPDSQLVTSGESAVRVWKPSSVAKAHAHGSVRGAAFSPDGKWIAIQTNTTLVRRDVAGTVVESVDIETKAEARSIAISDGGDIVFSVGSRLVRWPRGGALVELGTHEGASSVALATLRDGTPVSVSHDRLALWGSSTHYIVFPRESASLIPITPPFHLDDAGMRALVSCLPPGASGPGACLLDLASSHAYVLAASRGRFAMAANGRVAITGTDGDAYLVWDLDRRSVRTKLSGIGELSAVGISHDGTHAVVGGRFGVDRLDITRGTTSPLRGAERATGDMRYTPNGRTMIDEALTMWDVVSGESRTVAQPTVIASHVRDDGIVVVTPSAIELVPDDLPRDPAALKSLLVGLPYALDAHDSLVVK